MHVEQLTLNLMLRDDATFANFFSGDNVALLASLKKFVEGIGEQFIYLYGERGVGRTHLLQASAHSTHLTNQSAVYLAFKENKDLVPAILQNLEVLDLVCIDDIEAKLTNNAWEEALFHFYNRARESHTRLLVAGNVLPQNLPCCLPDLRSRLAWGLALQVHGLSDEDKLLALQMRAQNRGLELPQEVGNYLLHRYPRDMKTLFTVLEKLDNASMVAKRRLTIPFVKNVLE